MSRRQQGLFVLSFCRMLHTLESGRVTSEPEVGEWALRTSPVEKLHPARALDDRPGQWRQVHEQADKRAVARTFAFADYARRRMRR